MASEWAEMYTSALAQGEGFSRIQKEMIANALDATRYRFLREGRREGMEEALAIGKENMYSICAFKEIRARIEEQA